MKKIYKNPEIDVVVLKPMQLLAGSDLKVKGNYDGTITIAGRQSDSDWDDEEY